MWHEARRREKATQKLLNEHKKRAEKRREENRIDPNSLLQINGLKAKLCLDPSVYKQAVKSLVAWQGDKSITIDRFDVRATLSSIPNEDDESSTTSHRQSRIVDSSNRQSNNSNSVLERRNQTVLDANESEPLKKLLNYERYRLLIQNDLSRVPEELRLKLVSQSDVSADAKLRKLRFNKFGTSGDASINVSGSTSYMSGSTSSSSTGRLSGGESMRKPGVTIGFNYNSSMSQEILSDQDGKYNHYGTDENPVNKALAIMDLDEFDNFELDGVNTNNLEQFDTKRINEVARKYGLTRDEFIVIANRDGSDLRDILKELRKLDKRDSANKNLEESTNHDSSANCKRVYGPDLPPELMIQQDESSPSSSSSSQGSPIRQRSPSGARIPLRNGHMADNHRDINEGVNNRTSLSPNSPTNSNTQATPSTVHNSVPVKFIPESSSSKPADNSQDKSISPPPSPVIVNRKSESTHQQQKATSSSTLDDNLESMDDNVSQEQHHTVRRASTPLAYKRNRRSNRSLSRERRSSRHRQSRSSRRSRRSRSRSGSSSLSFASSRRSSSTGSDYSSRASRKRSRRRQSPSRHRKSTRRR